MPGDGRSEWTGTLPGADPRAARDALLLRSLAAAYAKADAELGADTARWGYSGNPVAMEHPLGGANPSWNVGPFAIPGSSTTPIAAGRASYKQVLDVGAWDRSLVINTPGQSGNPADPHYRDLARTWAAGQHVPMLFSDAAIAKNTERTILLVPTRR